MTIDGPAGTGKSSVARELARVLALEFLDTGAMYRAATALAIDADVPVDSEDQVARLVRRSDMRFDWRDDPPRLFAGGRDMTERVRDADVNGHVSIVAAMPGVRAVLVEAQRRIGEAHPALVTEGRDQGSVVFHDAQVKFYLDADVRVRAERRAKQLRDMGREREADAIRIAEQLRERDRIDTSRDVGPLCCPQDAQRLDTTALSREEVVRTLAKRVQDAVPSRILEQAHTGA